MTSRLLVAVALSFPVAAVSQQSGTIRGTVPRAVDGSPLSQVVVELQSTSLRGVTAVNGNYQLLRVPSGEHVVVFRWLSYKPHRVRVVVTDTSVHTVNVALERNVHSLADIVVSAAARVPQRVVDAPGAVVAIDPTEIRSSSTTNQLPLVLQGVPGVQVVATGMQRFTVNARGYNSPLNNRMLVLVDGREIANYNLGFQVWNAASVPMEDIGSIEVVKGPSSALYGANAFNGVISITTPTVREAAGSRLTVVGGELGTVRADVRHAKLFAGGRFGYRLGIGHTRSGTWDRSRTLTNGSSCSLEYAGIADGPVSTPACREIVALSGERIIDAAGNVRGERDPIRTTHGSARLDYYSPGGTAIIEGGVVQDANDVVVNSVGRVQPLGASLPWVRASWQDRRFSVNTWWGAQYVQKSIVVLPTGQMSPDENEALHTEGLYHQPIFERGTMVVGSSVRQTRVKSALLANPDDFRADWHYGLFGQLEYPVFPRVRAVVASRVDKSDRHALELSPKAALILSPHPRHTVRLSYARAFHPPTVQQNYWRGRLPPANLRALEDSLRIWPATAPAMTAVPPGTLFENSNAVTQRIIGNERLDVARITSVEVGYQTQVGDRLMLTVDAFASRLNGFIACCFAGVNAGILPWTAPPSVTGSGRSAVEDSATNRGLTRFGSSSVVAVSPVNSGIVHQRGGEAMITVFPVTGLRTRLSYAFLTFETDAQPRDVPAEVNTVNTPRNEGSLSVAYERARVDLQVSAQFSEAFDWFGGNVQFRGWGLGRVPSRQTVTASGGYQLTPYTRLHAIATNVFNQRRFYMLGGSVIGRRILGGATISF